MKWLMIILCLLLNIKSINASYVVMSDDEQILAQNDLYQVQSVASISKVMSAIIAIEHGDLNQKITVQDEILQVDGSSIYLRINDQVTLRDLIYGLMLRSGNDAAVCIAKHIAGSNEKFVEMMNNKAKALKMNHTLFHNPSGLDEVDGGNLSCAYDMALLMNYAMKNPIFKTIVSSKMYTSSNQIKWYNKNKLLFNYPYCNGGKTGYTKNAGRTLITTASKNNMNTIVVTLNESDDFNKHQSFHEQIFNDYTSKMILEKGLYRFGKYQINIKEDLKITIAKNEAIQVYSEIKDMRWKIEIKSNQHQWYYEYLIEVINE